jgi:hypothetical protein
MIASLPDPGFHAASLRPEDAMETYDPLVTPEPAEWLELDESQRIVLVGDYHERANVEIVGFDLHNTLHVIIENQLAEADDRVVTANFARLLAAGVNRHEAIHAMGFELAQAMLLAQKRPDSNFDIVARYHGGLERLKPMDWRGTV